MEEILENVLSRGQKTRIGTKLNEILTKASIPFTSLPGELKTLRIDTEDSEIIGKAKQLLVDFGCVISHGRKQSTFKITNLEAVFVQHFTEQNGHANNGADSSSTKEIPPPPNFSEPGPDDQSGLLKNGKLVCAGVAVVLSELQRLNIICSVVGVSARNNEITVAARNLTQEELQNIFSRILTKLDM